MTYSDIQNSGPSGRCFVYSKEKLEDKPHDLRPLLVAGESSVFPFIVVEKARVVDGRFAVCEPLPCVLCSVLENASRFLLR